MSSSCLRSAIALCLGCVLSLVVLSHPAQAQKKMMGSNGGSVLLLHCSGPQSYPGGKPTTDPCTNLPPVRDTDDLSTEYAEASDTVMVWVYLYNPCGFAVRGLGFGIRYEGVKVVTSGTCAELVYQDGGQMGTWAQSGSEIAFAWTPKSPVFTGYLRPVAWFLLARQERDGFFEVNGGRTSMSGAVADTSRVPLQDSFRAYGRIGFGASEGILPIEDPQKTAGSWGAVEIRIR